MRTAIPHPLRERRATRAAAVVRVSRATPALDPALERARTAGGPVDRARYVCQCGYAFLAPVTTTVRCPQCRAPQAW